jgi:predicted RND superfamily exporter protein
VIDNVLVEYFKPSTDVARADAFVREKFGGSKMVNVVVEGEKPGDVLGPEVLAAMDGLARYLADYVPEVGKTTGFTDMVKRINQVMHADADSEGVAPRKIDAAVGNKPAADTEPAFGFGSLGSFEEAAENEPAAEIKPAQTTPAGGSGKPLSEDSFAEYLSKALALADRRDLSAEDLTSNLKKAMNYKGAAYYEIPTDPARYGFSNSEELKGLVSNYLVLLSGDIGAFADDPLEPKSICMNVQLRTVGQRDTDRALEKMRTYVADNFPKNVKVIIGGTALVEKSLNNLVVQSQFVSLAVSLALVFLILSVYYRSLVAGFIGLAPLSISILINFAVMGWAGIKLNIGTAMVASIAIGVGIDYTIHYMAAYHNEFLLTGGKGDFLRRTFRDSGKVILMNAVSVGLGFAVLALSQFNILADLGKLILLTMATSSVVSLTLLPVLLNVLDPAFIRRPLPSDKNSQASMEVSK